MVKVEDIETMGWRKAIKGMRNPHNSWDRMDSYYENGNYILGPNDFDLACRLIKAGPEHRKFLRMIHIQMDITAPIYFFKEFDTYKVSTVANSCSTMHRIHTKEFTIDDFSCENLINGCTIKDNEEDDMEFYENPLTCIKYTLSVLNYYRNKYLQTKDKKYWWQLIQLLPSSYNQLRTWDGNMETILSILHQRAHHKLNTDWEPFRQSCFDNIPYCKEFYKAMYGKEEN